MWFYMKYIVKNYSDRIIFARLCTWLFHFKSCLIARNKPARRGAQLVPIGTTHGVGD